MAGRTALTLAVALLLSACGGAATPAAKPAPSAAALKSFDACALVTREAATKLVGGTLNQVSAIAQGPTGSCIYASSGSGAGVAVFIEQVPGGDARKVMQDALDQNSTTGTKLTAVKGIGDAAGTKVDANDAAVAFVKGQVFVIITATSGAQSGASLLPKVEALAKQVAAKL